MNRKLSLLFVMATFGLPALTHAQSASGIIAPSRIADWTQAGVQGGIPNRTSICATLSPGASASQINSAIASCPSGGVVYLNAGTYNLSSPIDFTGYNNITLRGAGPQATFLVFTGSGTSSSSCNGSSTYICVGGDPIYSTPSNLANWTGGYSQGSTSVTLDKTTNLAVGKEIIFDQLNNSSDTGNVYVCSACSTGGSGNISRSNRAQTQTSMVTNISGNVVDISPGIFMGNWASGLSPQAYWGTNQASGAGVENLTVNGAGGTALANIAFNDAHDCWMKNVVSLYARRDHVWLWYAAHISVVDSYFYGMHAYGTSAYDIETDTTSASLVMNNIFQHTVAPLTVGNDSGDVFAYNYIIDDYYTGSSNWMQSAINPHQEGTSMDLFEGNEVPSLEADDNHGSHVFLTSFRNRYIGHDAAHPEYTNNTTPVQIAAYGRYDNFVGNVLGYPGLHTNYQDLAPNGTNHNTSIYVLGWQGEGGKGSADTLVISTMMRWGNYDTATGSVRWNTSEVPSGLSLFANPVPSSQTLPASFFLSGKPGWWTTPWGTPPWPAIGPDVTGGPGPGGHSYDIPAKLCYDNTSKDSNGILNFNAISCYSSSPAPAPPTDLSATPH